MQPPATVFICHASSDNAIANRIADGLEQDGITPWLAPRSIRGGESYADAIVQGIRDSDSMVVLLTEEANQSAFVHREIERAVSLSKRLIVLRLAPVMPTKGLELFLSSTQWIEAHQIGIEKSIEALKDALRGRGATPVSAPRAGEAGPRHRRWRLWALVAATLALGCFAAFRGYERVGSEPARTKEPLASAAAVRSAARVGDAESVLALFSEQARGRQTQSRWQAIAAATRADLEHARGEAQVILQRAVPARATGLGEGSFFLVQSQLPSGGGYLCEQVLLREEPERWAAEAFTYWLSTEGACVGKAELERASLRAHAVLSTLKASGEISEDDRSESLNLVADDVSWQNITRHVAGELQSWQPESNLMTTVPLPGIPQGQGMPPLLGRFAQVRYAVDREGLRANLDLYMVQEADEQWRLAAIYITPQFN